MSGNSLNNQLFIVYHNGNVFNGDQNLEYMLYDTDKFKVIKKDELSISQNSTLEWIGFTEYGVKYLINNIYIDILKIIYLKKNNKNNDNNFNNSLFYFI